jgi:hypothetical protein
LKRKGGSAIAGPPFFALACAFFLPYGGMVFLQGVFRKSVVLVWCFCGENVVDCMVNVVL